VLLIAHLQGDLLVETSERYDGDSSFSVLVLDFGGARVLTCAPLEAPDGLSHDTEQRFVWS
jgi:hypothetical protein